MRAQRKSARPASSRGRKVSRSSSRSSVAHASPASGGRAVARTARGKRKALSSTVTATTSRGRKAPLKRGIKRVITRLSSSASR